MRVSFEREVVSSIANHGIFVQELELVSPREVGAALGLVLGLEVWQLDDCLFGSKLLLYVFDPGRLRRAQVASLEQDGSKDWPAADMAILFKVRVDSNFFSAAD